MSENEVIHAIGRRKSASARVHMKPGTGKIVINRRAFADYFPTEALRGYATQPYQITGLGSEFDLTITLTAVGQAGQAGAVRHGIARALEIHNPTCVPCSKPLACSPVDSREKERKSPATRSP